MSGIHILVARPPTVRARMQDRPRVVARLVHPSAAATDPRGMPRGHLDDPCPVSADRVLDRLSPRANGHADPLRPCWAGLTGFLRLLGAKRPEVESLQHDGLIAPRQIRRPHPILILTPAQGRLALMLLVLPEMSIPVVGSPIAAPPPIDRKS